MPLTKARIEILDEEAINPDRGLPRYIDVTYNPTEYSLAKSAQIAEIGIPGLDSPLLQYIRGQNEKLTLDLFFDTTEFGLDEGEGVKDVRTYTRSIYQLVKLQPRTHAPPRLKLTWGGIAFKAIVESVTQKFTLFNPTGIPLRATVSVVFREYLTLNDQLAENKQSPDKTKRRVVRQGDTLSQIAAEEYNDPNQWRLIASHNQQVLPSLRRLTPGTVLLIPPIEPPGSSYARPS